MYSAVLRLAELTNSLASGKSSITVTAVLSAFVTASKEEPQFRIYDLVDVLSRVILPRVLQVAWPEFSSNT
jgi:hypothetical protein